MKRSDVLAWVHQEFAPLTLSTVDETINQSIDNAVRYLNTYSAFRISLMASGGASPIQLPNTVKTVVKVYPGQAPLTVLTNYPMWSLLGIAVLDNASSDLILCSESFKNYKYYLGSDFRWTWERSLDSSIGGKLYTANFPSNATSLAVIGTKYFQLDETNAINDDMVLAMLLPLVKAYVKKAEGNILRKANLIGLANDGDTLYNEGKEEEKDIQQKISESGRWIAFATRI